MDGGDRIYVKERHRDREERENEELKKNKKKKGLNKSMFKQPQQKLIPEEQKIIMKVQEYYPDHSIETIKKVMKRCNNNIQLILNEMLEQKEAQAETRASSNQSLNDRNLQEDFISNLEGIEISKIQFEQLFQQISVIIQNNQEISALERNELIDHCKDSLDQFVKVTVGFSEQLNIEDVSYEDLAHRQKLLKQLQYFIEPIVKSMGNTVKNSKVNLNLQDFPQLSSSGGNSIVNQLHNQYTKHQLETQKLFQKKNEYFSKQTILPEKWNQTYAHFALSQMNGSGGRDIKQLATEYQSMDIKDIKIIFSYLGQDVDLCRKFLRENYESQQSKKRQKVVSSPTKSTQTKAPVAYYENQLLPNEQIMKLSLDKLRQFVNHHVKIRAVFMDACSRSSSNNEKKRLKHMGNQFNDLLNQYMKASKIKFLEKAMKETPNEIDLHGYFVPQAVEITAAHIDNLVKEARNANPRVTTRYRQGKLITELHVITGKGLNSVNRKGVLKPVIQELCDSRNINYEGTEGGILIRIPV